MSEVKAEYKQSENGAYDQFQFVLNLPDQADLFTITFILFIRYQVNGQEFWDNNSGKNYLINIARKVPLQQLRTADKCYRPRIDLSGSLLRRYDLAASLRAAKTPLMARRRVSRVLEPKEMLTPVSCQPRLELNSTAHEYMIQHLLHLKSENATAGNIMLASTMQPLSYPGVYPNQRSHTIHCF